MKTHSELEDDELRELLSPLLPKLPESADDWSVSLCMLRMSLRVLHDTCIYITTMPAIIYNAGHPL